MSNGRIPPRTHHQSRKHLGHSADATNSAGHVGKIPKGLNPTAPTSAYPHQKLINGGLSAQLAQAAYASRLHARLESNTIPEQAIHHADHRNNSDAKYRLVRDIDPEDIINLQDLINEFLRRFGEDQTFVLTGSFIHDDPRTFVDLKDPELLKF